MSELHQFDRGSADWRDSLRKNNRKTHAVILIFFMIYASIGLLIDAYLYSTEFPFATIPELLSYLVRLYLIPYATIIALAVAGISLLITYATHDKLMLMGTNAREITPENAQSLTEKQFYHVIEEMKVAAGLRFMPRVYILEENYMNAFASGYSEKSALVAITRGLLEKLDRDEVTAVMAHEISHIYHLDIKLTLMASVLANLILIMIDILFRGVIYSRRRKDSAAGNKLFIIIMILRLVLPLITIILTLFLSRSREYMADAGCVKLMRDNEPLARALLKIHEDHRQNSTEYSTAYHDHPSDNLRREAYLYDPTQAGIGSFSPLSAIFSTHPDLDSRLKAIGFKRRDT